MVVISMRFDRMRSQRFVGSMFVQPMSSSKSGIFMRVFCFSRSFSSCLLLREFGIRRVEKKLVISPTFCIFIVENQNTTKRTSDDYQGQSYGESVE